MPDSDPDDIATGTREILEVLKPYGRDVATKLGRAAIEEMARENLSGLRYEEAAEEFEKRVQTLESIQTITEKVTSVPGLPLFPLVVRTMALDRREDELPIDLRKRHDQQVQAFFSHAGPAPQHTTTKESRRPKAGAGDLRALRTRLQSRDVAFRAGLEEEVEKFRKDVLGGVLVPPSGVEGWVQKRWEGKPVRWVEIALERGVLSDAARAMPILTEIRDWFAAVDDKARTPPPRPHRVGNSRADILYFGNPNIEPGPRIASDRGVSLAIGTAPGTVLDWLRRLSNRLAKKYGWEPSQASAFVLTGSVPLLSTATHSFDRSTGRISLTVDAALTPPEVATLYRRARRDLLGSPTKGRPKNLPRRDPVPLHLAAFLLERRDEGQVSVETGNSAELSATMAAWNRRPESAGARYGGDYERRTSRFKGDCRAALENLRPLISGVSTVVPRFNEDPEGFARALAPLDAAIGAQSDNQSDNSTERGRTRRKVTGQRVRRKRRKT